MRLLWRGLKRKRKKEMAKASWKHLNSIKGRTMNGDLNTPKKYY
jgi:hypothetical protein